MLPDLSRTEVPVSIDLHETHETGHCPPPAESRPLKPPIANKMALMAEHANDNHTPGV